ncbi:MAG: type II toxin-antitoxin system RelE/ParE family toxin [Clostridiales Family XIII bacterium]|nr:type II toxin-antitoxin system RelE/ParE family toxin [Clostridiales Family XIII bacterium]
MREVLFGNYRIMYRIESDTVIITQVRHTARIFNP